MEMTHETTAIVLWDGCKTNTAVEAMSEVPSLDVKFLLFAMTVVYETLALVPTSMAFVPWVTGEDKTTVDAEPSLEMRRIYETLNVATLAIETIEEEPVQKQDSVPEYLNTFGTALVHSDEEELERGQTFEESKPHRQVMSSLQANAGIHIDGIFAPYTESSQRSCSSIEDKHKQLSRENKTKKITNEYQGAASMKIDVIAAL